MKQSGDTHESGSNPKPSIPQALCPICLRPPSPLSLFSTHPLIHSSTHLLTPSSVCCLLPPETSYLAQVAARSPDQLCKTNPVPSTPKPTQTFLPQRITKMSRPAALEKTNPIKPNPPAPPERNTPATWGTSAAKAACGAIRDTKYAIRNTDPIKPRPPAPKPRRIRPQDCPARVTINPLQFRPEYRIMSCML